MTSRNVKEITFIGTSVIGLCLSSYYAKKVAKKTLTRRDLQAGGRSAGKDQFTNTRFRRQMW
jgi:hypothetical protein